MVNRCAGGRLVLAWLKANKLTQTWLARELGVKNAVLWRWLSGGRQPRTDFAAAIERITDGQVKSSVWRPVQTKRAA